MTTMLSPAYIKIAERPDLTIDWYDSEGVLIDFSVGYAFELKIGYRNQTALLTKTLNITGAATSPNVRVIWDAGELDTLSADRYIAQIKATINLIDRVEQFDIGIINPVL